MFGAGRTVEFRIVFVGPMAGPEIEKKLYGS